MGEKTVHLVDSLDHPNVGPIVQKNKFVYKLLLAGAFIALFFYPMVNITSFFFPKHDILSE